MNVSGMVNDEPAAHEQQQELPELLEEVVDPLDQVLEVVDVQPDLEDPLEQMPVPARLVGDGVVGVDLLEPAHRLLDAIGQAADHAHPLARHRGDLALQPPDEEHLNREEHHADERHPRVRVDHEPEGADQHGAVERRRGERQAEVAPRSSTSPRIIATSWPVEVFFRCGSGNRRIRLYELAPEVAEHRLRDVAFDVLLHVLERAVQEHRAQEAAAEPQGGRRSSAARSPG